MVSRFASKIRCHCCASPYSRLAILERLSPFFTVYVLPVAGLDAVDELPDSLHRIVGLGPVTFSHHPSSLVSGCSTLGQTWSFGMAGPVTGVTPLDYRVPDNGFPSVSLPGFLTVWMMREMGKATQFLSTACGDVVAKCKVLADLSMPINIDSTLCSSSRREMSACTGWGKLQIVGTSL